MKKHLTILTLALLFTGCASLKPGNDPLVVRTEQIQAISYTTLDLFVHVEDLAWRFWATNLPALHQYAEWLRTPVGVNADVPTTTAWATRGTGPGIVTLPRGVAICWNLDQIKLAYINSQASSNTLMTALATVQTAVSQANSWLAIATNTPLPLTP